MISLRAILRFSEGAFAHARGDVLYAFADCEYTRGVGAGGRGRGCGGGAGGGVCAGVGESVGLASSINRKVASFDIVHESNLALKFFDLPFVLIDLILFRFDLLIKNTHPNFLLVFDL
jgi:hypothetical protein